MPRKRIKLEYGETVVAVVPEVASGPGWANSPVFIYIRSVDGHVRSECLQPREQTDAMRAAFTVCTAAHELMMREANRLIRPWVAK